MSEETIKINRTKQEERMANGKLIPLMLSLGIPTFIAQLINLLYNIVDRIYLGHIEGSGTDALTGIGLCLPVITFVSAFAMLVGAGGSPLAAISLGKGDRDEAERILGNGVLLLCIFSVSVTTIFYIVKKPFLYLFGASDSTYPYANDYLQIYLLGTLFVMFAMGLNMFLTAQGKSTVAMISVLIGAVLNIILDPVFIFLLHLDIKGAAIATVISQGISALFVTWYLMSLRSGIRIKFKNLRLNAPIIGKMVALGISPFIMSVTESLITISYNRGMQKYGSDLYVGSITILQSIMQIIFTPIQGFAQGVVPIVSFNYGAQNYKRCKETCKKLVTIIFTIAFVLSIAGIMFPRVISGMFTSDAKMLDLCEKYLPVFVSGMLIFGLQSGCQQCFVALGQAKQSLFFALLRKVFLLIPLVLILPAVTGNVVAIYFAEPISDAVSAVFCFVAFLVTAKRLLNEPSASSRVVE